MDKKSRSKNRKRSRKRIKNFLRRKDVLLVVSIILIPVIIFIGVKYFESDLLSHSKDDGSSFDAKAMTVNGINYYPRRDITTLMLLGMNIDGNESSSAKAALLVADNTAAKYSIIKIDPETVDKMPSLALINADLAKDICTQSRSAISETFNGIYIDHYAAVNASTLDLGGDELLDISVSEILFGDIEFIATDCSVKALSKLADDMSSYTYSETVTVDAGDEQAVEKVVIKYFYETK